MDYRVFNASSGEEDNSTEAHVFARAYRAAWRSAYASEPAGRHGITGLELVIDFGGHPVGRIGTVQVDKTQPTLPCPEPASTSGSVAKGERHGH